MRSKRKLAPSGLVIRGLRSAVGITQQGHAEALDTSPGSLSKIETGQKTVPYERLFEMIAVLNGRPPVPERVRLG